MNKILVVAVHPDDETLGCGGTLLKHKSAGDEIHCVFCTDVKVSNGFSQEVVDGREDEIRIVENLYNFKSLKKMGLSTTKVDEYNMSNLTIAFTAIIKEIEPCIIYLPFRGDVHSDHRKIFEAAYSCTKSFRYPFIKKIYMMETLSETEFSPGTPDTVFIPNVFIDISEYMDKKIEIMKIYKSEMGEHPFPRSEKNIRALATYRGATAGCEYAESFMLIKEII